MGWDWLDDIVQGSSDLISGGVEGIGDIFKGTYEAIPDDVKSTVAGGATGGGSNTYENRKAQNKYEDEVAREMQRKADEFNAKSAEEKKAEVQKLATYFKNDEDYTSEVGDFFSLDQGRDISSHENYRFLYSEGGKSFYQDIGKEKKYGWMGTVAGFANLIPRIGAPISSLIRAGEASAEGEGFDKAADIGVRGLAKAAIVEGASYFTGGNPIAVSAATGLATTLDEKTKGGGTWSNSIEEGARAAALNRLAAMGPEWGAVGVYADTITRPGGTQKQAIINAASAEAMARGSTMVQDMFNSDKTMFQSQPDFGGTYAGKGLGTELLRGTGIPTPTTGPASIFGDKPSAPVSLVTTDEFDNTSYKGLNVNNSFPTAAGSTKIINSVPSAPTGPVGGPTITNQNSQKNNSVTPPAASTKSWWDYMEGAAALGAVGVGLGGLGLSFYNGKQQAQEAKDIAEATEKDRKDQLELAKAKFDLEKLISERNYLLSQQNYRLSERQVTNQEKESVGKNIQAKGISF